MNLGTAQVIQGDARHLPLEDNTVDLVVTSPPYFALRSYQDGGAHYDGQLGSESTPAEFVAALLEVTRECVRVLKPSGSLWVNLGDKYARTGGGGGGSSDGATGRNGTRKLPASYTPTSEPEAAGTSIREELLAHPSTRPATVAAGAREKSLIGIPWRYALACIDDLGLILRAELIWAKPNGLPESVTDRVRRSHEQWFHFVLEPRYFSAVDEIREGYDPKSLTRIAAGFNPTKRDAVETEHNGMMRARGAGESADGYTPNPLGKLPGSVWTVPTQPLQVPPHLGVDHFAAFPTEWPRRIIQGWSPAGVCVECGEGRRPVVLKGTPAPRLVPGRALDYSETATQQGRNVSGQEHTAWKTQHPDTITGYVCGCTLSATGGLPASTTPAVVLDPFGGTGTTALVAKALGRHGITLDMSADYCRLAEWRTNDRDSLAKVLGIAKADAPDDSQLDLFGEATA